MKSPSGLAVLTSSSVETLGFVVEAFLPLEPKRVDQHSIKSGEQEEKKKKMLVSLTSKRK